MNWLRGRLHPTWVLTVGCFGLLVGVTLAAVWRVEPLVAATAGVALILVSFMKPRRWLLALALVGSVLLGLSRGSVARTSLDVYESLYGKHTIITGTVADDADASNQKGSKLRLRNLNLDGHHVPGSIFASVSRGENIRRSDVVTIDGVMERGFGNFAASITGAVTDVARPSPGDVALNVRDAFATNVREGVKEPEASLGIGYLLGQKSALPADLIDELKVVGLTHIIVASGYNLTILIRLTRRLFARISKYLTALTGVALIVGFVMMTGLSPSMSRAGLVAGLSLWAWYYGRKFHPVTLLGLAAAVTVMANPSYTWGDIGWLLSFAAFAGVMIVAPIVTAYYFGNEQAPFVGQILIETIAAQVMTAPIIIMVFQQFSVISPLANLLILPLIPLTMLFVAVAGAGAFIPGLATIAGWPAEQLLTIQTKIIEWCAAIPWAQSKPEWQWQSVLIYFTIVAGVVVYMKWRTKFNLRTASLIE